MAWSTAAEALVMWKLPPAGSENFGSPVRPLVLLMLPAPAVFCPLTQSPLPHRVRSRVAVLPAAALTPIVWPATMA